MTIEQILDGYTLKNFALLVSKEKNSDLISFGPQNFRLEFLLILLNIYLLLFGTEI